MLRRITILSLAIAALGTAASMASPMADLGTEKNPIVWAYVPSGDTAKVSAGAQQVADILHAQTGLYFKTFVATDYVGVIEALRADPPKAHMSSLATAAYILAADQKLVSARLVSVRNGSTSYQAQVIAGAKTGIKKLADIKGKTFARVDLLSASGWIIPSLMLKAAGVDPARDVKIIDAGSHPNVVTAVYSGQADAGACFIDARANIQKDHPDVMDKVVVVELSGSIPNDGVQFSPAMPAELRDKIVDGILQMIKTDAGKAAINTAYQWTALERCEDSFYDPFRQFLQAAGVTPEYLMPKK